MKEINEKQNLKAAEMSRRKFLSVAATGVAGLTILPSFTVSGLGHMAPSDKLYIAKLGCGGMGAADLECLVNTPRKNAVIAYLCDVDGRMAAGAQKKFPKAPLYEDWRELYEKEHKNFDAVCISTPDHNHAIQAFGAMRMGKHVYLQKPLSHDIYEARILTDAAKKYKVVTQMGDQGNSCDGMKTMREWLDADLIGDIQKVYCWTNRPVWPQGIPWPTAKASVPKELNWDLWLGTARHVDYIENLIPFNWRGWWEFGTGALGDMGCHIIGPPFKLLGLGYPSEVSCSVTNQFTDIFKEAYYPESAPVASSIRFKFKQQNGKNLDLYWMDGGIMPERFDEIDPNADMTTAMGDLDPLDVEGATVFVGTKGKISCGWGGSDPRLWVNDGSKKPLFAKDVNLPQKYERIEGGTNGHYWAWIDSCIAGYDKANVESPFEGYAGPLTEAVLMGNLILRSYNIREEVKRNDSVYGEMEAFLYPGRNITYQWDGANMRITNFEAANQFVKREYRKGWEELKL
ncbi:Gfo/Idh/MocA family protein [Dysgonomonas sp. ZJ709]|uniref:Gfo/Idh/MocA family protein n=1 Tax=Dysgonomonas sp. ZJ709 TaxID=2709797 RepID=UPI0013EAFDE1|nr:Gfo/Idh/MocA family oxidoreductase [Dysgonomonas sp. ZJ709]